MWSCIRSLKSKLYFFVRATHWKPNCWTSKMPPMQSRKKTCFKTHTSPTILPYLKIHKKCQMEILFHCKRHTLQKLNYSGTRRFYRLNKQNVPVGHRTRLFTRNKLLQLFYLNWSWIKCFKSKLYFIVRATQWKLNYSGTKWF